MKLNTEQLVKILRLHSLWRQDDPAGSRADLQGADLQGADLQGADLHVPISCPKEGEFTAFKKCAGGIIVKLLIPADAKRSSATGRKCRASKAIVLDTGGAEVAYSQRDNDFEYRVGATVEPKEPFCDDRFDECASGIHFFITRREAEEY